MAKTPDEQAEARAALSRAQQYQESQKKSKEQEESIEQAQIGTAAHAVNPTSPSGQPSQGGQAVSGSGQAPTEPPKLRHRDEVLPGDKLMPSSAPPPSVHAPRPELLATRKVAEGVISEAQCSRPATLEIRLESSAGVMQLYSDNFFQVPYSALNFTPKGSLNPCTDIKGWHARITYHPAKGEAKQGEIVAVGLAKD